MSRLFPSILFTLCFSSLFAQNEFGSNTNGLIYAEKDIVVLRSIVDSLNIRFRKCDNTPGFVSAPSAKFAKLYFESKTNDLSAIIKDLENKLTYQEILNKYDSLLTKKDTSLLLVRMRTDYNNSSYYFLSGNALEGFDEVYPNELFTKKEAPLPVGSFWSYLDKKYLGSYTLDCYFITSPWNQQAIPETYAQLIQYVDCMVDTSVDLYTSDFSSELYFRNLGLPKEGKKSIALRKYINKKATEMHKKDLGKVYLMDEGAIRFATINLRSDKHFEEKLRDAVDEAVRKKTRNSFLEDLTSGMNLPALSLQLKRSYRVMGMCSQDRGPRIQGFEIALLSARARQWDIFLRAHLNIMNDYFERMSDGSYAQQQRRTYLKELEELNLNVVDLLLGLCLRADNTAASHYNGSIMRIGRALTESKDREMFEQKAKQIIKDQQLDLFNRTLVFHLLCSYYMNLEEKEVARSAIAAIRSEAGNYPPLFRDAILKLQVEEE